jgi:fibro-slime domain-containing protein
VLKVILRDFRSQDSGATEAHPDFEPIYKHTHDVQKGLVEETLGNDGKPVWRGCPHTSACAIPDKASFREWYNTGPRNREVKADLVIQQVSPGEFTLDMPNFFPLNNQGFKDTYQNWAWLPYNYYFTMEAKHAFVYYGGEWFTFRGDDDLWIFFNNKLALDLGGVHSQAEQTFHLDDHRSRLGLEVGKTVYLNIFFAERGFSSSNFKISTNIKLNEDVCIQYDRLAIVESPVMNHLSSGGPLAWNAEFRRSNEMYGQPVVFRFKCVDDQYCNHNQKGNQNNFPVVEVGAARSMPLTLELVSGGDAIEEPWELGEYYITFYNLLSGMKIKVIGTTGYTRLGDTDITYSKAGEYDVFGSHANTGEAPVFTHELTEDQKKRSVMLTFKSLVGAQIVLENHRAGTAGFMFTATPMFDCVPCFPACEDNEPLVQTRTTTTTVTSAVNLGGGGASSTDVSIASDGDYECCFFDHFGVRIACHEGFRPVWIPWCPEPPGLGAALPEGYECCVFDHFGFQFSCHSDRPWWIPWCP